MVGNFLLTAVGTSICACWSYLTFTICRRWCTPRRDDGLKSVEKIALSYRERHDCSRVVSYSVALQIACEVCIVIIGMTNDESTYDTFDHSTCYTSPISCPPLRPQTQRHVTVPNGGGRCPRGADDIYGMYGATCTQRVLMTAMENNTEYDLKLVDIRKGEQKQPEHLARQPFGFIPVLEDGNFRMYESRAITRYVNDTRGNKLVPQDAQKRALMEQWISLEQGTITPEVQAIVVQRVFAPMHGGKVDEEIVKKHTDKVKPALDIMDAHLAKNEYLAGDQFTLLMSSTCHILSWRRWHQRRNYSLAVLI